MTILNDNNFSQEVENFSGIALVDFYADWCGPCRMITPIVSELAQDYASDGDVKIVKVNVDEAQSVAMKYGIMSIPTLLLFKNGKKVAEKVGVQSKTSLIELINNSR